MPTETLSPVLIGAAVIGGYLLGSIPFGVVVMRLAGAGDPRAIGSGNIGATNVLRTGRKDLAALTFLGDSGKGALAVLIAWLLTRNGPQGPRDELVALAAGWLVFGIVLPGPARGAAFLVSLLLAVLVGVVLPDGALDEPADVLAGGAPTVWVTVCTGPGLVSELQADRPSTATTANAVAATNRLRRTGESGEVTKTP